MPATIIQDIDGSQSYFMDDQDYIILDSGGSDSYTFGDGDNIFLDDEGDDEYSVGNGNNIIYAGGGTNWFTIGNGYNLILDLDNGNNTYYLNDGEYLIADGGGNSTFYTAGGTNTIYDGAGHDTYHLGSGTNIIYGGLGNDVYVMNNGGNIIVESYGMDSFVSGTNADYIDGGEDFDIVYYINSASGIIVDLNVELQEFYANGVPKDGGDAQGDRLLNIESVYGSNYDDMIYGHISSDNILYGGDGDDNITGGRDNDIIYGGNGDDNLSGDTTDLSPHGDDVIYGELGNDTYYFKGGHDFFYETGADTDLVQFDYLRISLDDLKLIGNTIFVTDSRTGTESSITFNDINLFEEFSIMHAPSDFITHSFTVNELQAALTDDYYFATAAAEDYDGMGGYDTVDYSTSTAAITINAKGSGGFAQGDTYDLINKIVGSDYDDTFYANYNSTRDFDGGDGDDLFIMNNTDARYTFDGGDGFDTIDFSPIGGGTSNGIPNSVDIDLEAGTFTGYNLEDDIFTNIEGFIGTKNNDNFHGDANANTFHGGAGNDSFYGGAGVDELYGGADSDLFSFDTANGEVDNIYDFDLAEGDIIDIANILQGYDELSDAIADFVQITDNGTDSFVAVDADGGADNFVMVAQLHNVTGLDVEAMEADGNLYSTL